MKEERVSIFSYARYHFHNLFVKGTFARVIAFTIVTVVACIILGFVLSLIPCENGGLLTSIWNATLCALDGGTIAGMEVNEGQKVAMIVWDRKSPTILPSALCLICIPFVLSVRKSKRFGLL